MNIMMPLLVCTVALLVGPTVTNPTTHQPEDNLNRIIELGEKYNETLTREFFVEDLEHLVGGCEDKFFCKAYDILHKHEHFGKRNEGKEEKELVRNLKIFLDREKFNCAKLLKEVTSTGESKPIPKLVNHLMAYIKQRNLSGPKKCNT